MARVRPGEAAHPAPPTVLRLRVRYAKRGRMRFLSHRDVARSVERAVRRAGLPVSYSHGFSPHPRLSWLGAAPTGAASEAEYVEIGLTSADGVDGAREALDAALPPGLDVLDVVVAGPGALADRVDASIWRIELLGVDPDELRAALVELSARERVVVERVVPSGRREIDVRAALAAWEVGVDAPVGPPAAVGTPTASVGCAILTAVVRQTTPAARPDDVLAALDVVAGLRPPVPARATRTAQGLLDSLGRLADPLGPDRAATESEGPAGDQHDVDQHD